ncbi:hypothetical protein [Candidatus Uabimicrobium sp. HlEnr_7]|uniref:hypothetical protein n=1 Tax=Candidatus Uabimicrobium helgolandensis TaxID=3095367 RepID=UPI003557A6CD
MKQNEISIEFYDFINKKLLKTVSKSLEQLPDVFEKDTAIHFSDSHWVISEALPSEKSEFQESGKVKLFLSKTEVMDPKKILYSLPSISEDIPNIIESDTTEGTLVLLEDDWRQVECLEARFLKNINEELSQIRNVYENERESAGFRNMHLRKLILSPLGDKTLLIEHLEKHFEIKMRYNSVGFSSSYGVIENGFALATESNWIFWGQLNDNNHICFLNVIAMANALVEPFSSQMNAFLKDEKLYLVDWTRMFVAGNNQESFTNFMHC